jgi:ABC-type antimicrobial peptide transport system permease subunit
MNSLLQDLRYALRQLLKSPGFTAVALLTLALGIGANTGIFTLVNAIFLKSLPVPNPEQLFLVRHSDRLAENTRFSYPIFENVRSAIPLSVGLAAMTWPADFYASLGNDQPEMVTGQLVSGNYFQTLETYAALGRLLTSDNDRVVGGSPVAVISYGCWERRFGRDQSVIGRKIVINGMPFGVIGVADHRFQIVGVVKDARVNDIRESAPPMIYHALAQNLIDVESLDVRTFGDPAQLVLDIRQAVRSVDLNLPIGGITTVAEQLRNNLAQQRLIARLTAIFGALALGLACLGLYGMMSYTVARRTSELGIRLALGASRTAVLWLVLRQTLAMIGAGIAAGLLLAFLAGRTVTSLLFGLSPYDPATVLVAAALLLLVSVGSGIKPAWHATQVNPTDALRAE